MKERRKIAHERRRNIAVGLTTLFGLGGLVALLMAFGYVPTLFRSGYTVTLYMDNVSGLHPNSPVTLWGSDIGEVEEVGFTEPGASRRAYVKLRIDDEIQIPADVNLRVETPLFGGGPVISMIDSTPGAPLLPRDGSAVLDNARVIDPLVQLEVVSTDITELKQTWVGVGENINTLFAGEGADQASLPRVVLGLEHRLDELERVLAGAEAWFGDEQLRADVSQTAANARALSEQLAGSVAELEARYLALADAAEERLAKVDQTLDSAERTLHGAGTSIAEIESRYVALADDAAKVIAEIDGMVARADSKDSTIGLLLSDPQLYHNLTDTAERLRLMVDEARLLIQKWKAEGVPLRVFN